MQKIIKFDSGFTLVYVHNSFVSSVATGVFVGAGAATESPELSGISHFIEHMVFKGTKKRSAFDIVNEMDSVGAQINAYTAKSYTCFYTVSLDEHAERCAEMLSDLYFEPAFDGEELEKERRVVIEEINESEDTPDDVCLERLFTCFFDGHPLGKPILGTKKTLSGMTSDTLHAYRKKQYTPCNTVLSIAGNISEKTALDIAKKYFEDRFERPFEAPCEQSQPPLYSNSKAVTTKRHIEQAHLAFAFPSVGIKDSRTVYVQLLTSIFGSEMSSRLFQRIREELGLCYTIIGYPSAYRECGAFVIQTATSPENALKAATAIREEIDRLLDGGVSQQELDKGKQQLKTALVLAKESTSSMMRTFGTHAVTTGELYDFDSRTAAIDAATRQDVLDVALSIFDFDKMCSSLVAKNVDVDIFGAMKGC